MSLTARYVTALTTLIVLACGFVGAASVAGNLAYSHHILSEHATLTALLMADLAEDNPDIACAAAVNGTPEDVYAAALYDSNLNVVSMTVEKGYEANFPTTDQLHQMASTVQTTSKPTAFVDNDSIVALADVSLPKIKYAVVVLSATNALDNLRSSVQFAVWVVVFFAVVGSIVAFLIARRVTRPVQALARATSDLERGEFDPGTLRREREHSGEFGTLARRFTEMASEVQKREREMAAQLALLQVKIDDTERQRSVATITASAAFADLENRAAALRARRHRQEGSTDD